MHFSSSVFIATAFLILSFATLASAESSTQSLLTANLSLGSRNAQVIVLQQILNRDPDTRIASTGPGSLGNETNYFGTLTRSAIIRFQMKYANEILAPVGLTQGNGFVGSYTRTKLNTLSAAVENIVSVNPPIVPPAVTPPIPETTTANASDPVPLYPNMPIPAGVNPNTINLDYEIALVTKVGKQQGVSDADIQKEIRNIREITATTTNLVAEFFSSAQRASPAPSSPLSFIDSIKTVFTRTLSSLGLGPIEHAQAATLAPFGGHIVFVYVCTCTMGEVYRVTLSPPLPPFYATLLDAPVGTQLFASYNSPLTGIYDLGFYTPGAPTCIMYYGETCAPNIIPGWGTITPFVGSSPL